MADGINALIDTHLNRYAEIETLLRETAQQAQKKE